MDVFLSVCMIVKDEEMVLERCLQSIHGIADEIIIVDTGSEDKTKEIAYRFSDKVYDFEWISDFAKARNYSASKAKGEWILVIDADEYVDRDTFQQFKNDLKTKYNEYEILAPQIVSFVGSDASQTILNYHERIYKNNGLIKYDRPVHEELIHKNGKDFYYPADLKIYHSGYMAKTVKEKDKNERNLKILLNKKDKIAIDYFYLGNEYNALHQPNRAIDHYKKAFQMQDNHQVEWDKKLLINLIITLHKERRYQEALSIAEAGVEKYPQYADFLYYKGLIHFETKNYEESKRVFEKIINGKDQYQVDSSLELLELLPTIHLAEIYEEYNIQKSVEYYSRAVSLTENNMNQWVRLLYLIGKNATLDQLTDFINNNVVSSAGMTETKLIKILLEVPVLNVQKLSRSLLDNQKLSETQNDALMIRNHLLDYHFEEVYMILEEWSDEKVAEVLHTGIFSIQDFLMFTMLTEYERGQKLLGKLNFSKPITNLFNLIFDNGKRNLNKHEEDLFLQMYKQGSVLGIDNVKDILDGKVFALSNEKRKELREIQEGKL